LGVAFGAQSGVGPTGSHAEARIRSGYPLASPLLDVGSSSGAVAAEPRNLAMKNAIDNVKNRLSAFFTDTRGGEMVEYMIVLGVVALISIGAFTQFGGSIKSKIGEQGGTVGSINAGGG
jgi:Flp pilus assembly pilin Flp